MTAQEHANAINSISQTRVRQQLGEARKDSFPAISFCVGRDGRGRRPIMGRRRGYAVSLCMALRANRLRTNMRHFDALLSMALICTLRTNISQFSRNPTGYNQFVKYPTPQSKKNYHQCCATCHGLKVGGHPTASMVLNI